MSLWLYIELDETLSPKLTNCVATAHSPQLPTNQISYDAHITSRNNFKIIYMIIDRYPGLIK